MLEAATRAIATRAIASSPLGRPGTTSLPRIASAPDWHIAKGGLAARAGRSPSGML